MISAPAGPSGAPFSRTTLRCWRRLPSVRPVIADRDCEIEEADDEPEDAQRLTPTG